MINFSYKSCQTHFKRKMGSSKCSVYYAKCLQNEIMIFIPIGRTQRCFFSEVGYWVIELCMRQMCCISLQRSNTNLIIDDSFHEEIVFVGCYNNLLSGEQCQSGLSTISNSVNAVNTNRYSRYIEMRKGIVCLAKRNIGVSRYRNTSHYSFIRFLSYHICIVIGVYFCFCQEPPSLNFFFVLHNKYIVCRQNVQRWYQ